MSNSKLKSIDTLKDAKDPELEKLRLKVMDAIRFSEKYWMIYKEETFGLATILDLFYRKSFIEVLFFTNKAVLKKGVPIVKIFTPIESEVDFNEIIFEPDFDDDGLISPVKIIERINNLIEIEFRVHLSLLDKEARLIEEKFENYIIDDNPYFRRIIIHFPNFHLNLKIYFEKYPLIPRFIFSRDLTRIIRVRDFVKTQIIKNWDEENPPRLVDLIDVLINIIAMSLNISPLPAGSQNLIIEDLSVVNEINNISLTIPRGKSIGIYFALEKANISSGKLAANYLFRAITGDLNFTGKLKIFGEDISPKSASNIEGIFTVSHTIDSSLENRSIKKAIEHNMISSIMRKLQKTDLTLALDNAGLLRIKDEIASIRKKLRRNEIHNALQATGLLNIRKEKVSNLSKIERILFSISRVLLKSPKVIMFSVPLDQEKKVEIDNLNRYIRKIKETYHVIIIVHGPKEIVSNCDQIINIAGKEAKIGSIEELISEIPQSGEIISIELKYPTKPVLTRMLGLDSALFIEERKNEKYKIFPKENPDQVILQLMEVLGPHLHNFKRYQASLEEYLEFKNLSNVRS